MDEECRADCAQLCRGKKSMLMLHSAVNPKCHRQSMASRGFTSLAMSKNSTNQERPETRVVTRTDQTQPRESISPSVAPPSTAHTPSKPPSLTSSSCCFFYTYTQLQVYSKWPTLTTSQSSSPVRSLVRAHYHGQAMRAEAIA